MQNIASLDTDEFPALLARLPPDLDLDQLAIEHKAIQRGRKIKTGTELLRLALAPGPGGMSLRDAAGWWGMLGLGTLHNPPSNTAWTTRWSFSRPSPLTCWRQDRPAKLCTGRVVRYVWPMAPAFPNRAARALTRAGMA